MLELQDDGGLGPAKEHPTAFRVELPRSSQQLRFLDAKVDMLINMFSSGERVG